MVYLNKQLIDQVDQVINLDNANKILLLIIIVFFIWLSNGFKQQQIESKKIKMELYEKRIKAYSSILYESKNVNLSKGNDDFFKAVHDSYHVINKKALKEILLIMNSKELNRQKINSITNLISIYLDKEVKKSLMELEHDESEGLFSDMEKLSIRIAELFKPYLISIFFIFGTLIMISLYLSAETELSSITRPLGFSVLIFLLILMFDSWVQKSMSADKFGELFLGIILAFCLIVTSGYVLWLSVLILITLFSYLMKKYKNGING